MTDEDRTDVAGDVEQMPDESPDVPAKRARKGPAICTVRRRTAGGGWERCSVFDASSDRKVDRFPASDLGRDFERVRQVWGGGEYEITRRRGRQLDGKASVTFEGAPLPAYARPEVPAPPAPPVSAPAHPDRYGDGFQAGLLLAQQGFGMIVAMLEQARQNERQDSEIRLQRERAYAEERLKRERQDHEASLARILQIEKMAKGDDVAERVSDLEAELSERAADPDRWAPLVNSLVDGLKESVGPLIAASVAKKMGV